MTTVGAIGVGLGTGLRAARAARRQDAAARAGTRARPGAAPAFLARLGSSILTLAALALFCLAAFEAHTIAGLVTTGLALLVAEWRLSPAPDADEVPNANNRRI